jgi:hypothetical protein
MHKRAVGLLTIVLLLLMVGSVAYASIPDSQGVIHACRKLNAPDKGLLRAIDSEAGQSCPAGWAPLNWDQSVPVGTVTGLTTVDDEVYAPGAPGNVGGGTIYCLSSHPKLVGSLAWETDNTGGVHIAPINTRPATVGADGREGVDFLVNGELVNNDRVLLHMRAICAKVRQ